MPKYTIRVECDNPEYEVGEVLRNGLEVDGFVLLAYKDGKPFLDTMNGISVEDLGKHLRMNSSEVVSVLRQAMAIAEGYRRAMEIHRADRVDEMVKKFVRMEDREG